MKSNILPLLYAICGVVIVCCVGIAVVPGDAATAKDICTHGIAALAGLGTGIGLGSAKKDASA